MPGLFPYTDIPQIISERGQISEREVFFFFFFSLFFLIATLFKAGKLQAGFALALLDYLFPLISGNYCLGDSVSY